MTMPWKDPINEMLLLIAPAPVRLDETTNATASVANTEQSKHVPNPNFVA